jgi:hypothetical protein
MSNPADAQTDIALALQTLRSVCADEQNSAASRSAAGRTLLEFYGFLGTGRTHVPDLAGKSHTELSLAELRRRAQELRTNGAKPTPADPSDPF